MYYSTLIECKYRKIFDKKKKVCYFSSQTFSRCYATAFNSLLPFKTFVFSLLVVCCLSIPSYPLIQIFFSVISCKTTF